MKTDELTGAALNWAVAKATGEYKPVSVPQYSTDWAHGGAIIERERISVAWNMTRWVAWTGVIEHKGETPLIAAMRCYVSGELGSEVDVPEEVK